MKIVKYIRYGIKNTLNLLKKRDYNLILQLLLNYIWAFFKIPFMVPKPLELQIEPFLGCNLRCKMCNINQIVKKTKSVSMTEENFNFLLNNIFPMKTINFTGMGESLLNKNLEKFIIKANLENIETLFITNGQLLDSQRVDNIISSKVKRICISMESADPTTYESIRCGALFDRLRRNIKYLTKKIKKLNSNLVVSLNVVLLKHNIEDETNIYKIIDFAKQCEVSDVTLQNPHDLVSNGTFVYFTKKKNDLKSKFQLIKRYADRKNVRIFFPSIDIKEGSCYYPWVYPQITASGELLPCCIIPQFGDYSELIKEYSFGNVFTKNFSKVWNSKKAKNFRMNLVQENPNKYCRKCSKYLGIL